MRFVKGGTASSPFDLDRVGVVGWSMGGNAAVRIAGGTGDGDDRVKAIAAMAPVISGLTADGIASIEIPALVGLSP